MFINRHVWIVIVLLAFVMLMIQFLFNARTSCAINSIAIARKVLYRFLSKPATIHALLNRAFCRLGVQLVLGGGADNKYAWHPHLVAMRPLLGQ